MSEYVTKRVDALRVDYTLVALLALTVVFQVGAIALAQWFSGLSTEPTQTSNVSISVWFAGIVIVESLVLVGLWRLYNRLSGFWQRVIKWAVCGLIVLTEYGLIFYLFGIEWVVIGLAASTAGWAVYRYTSVSQFTWVAFNTIAIGGGIVITGLMSQIVGPPVVIAIMLMLLLWDKIAVDLTDLMGDLVSFSGSVSVPNFVIIPRKLRFELAPIREFIADPETTDRPDSVALIIGVGDFLFPALLTASALVAYTDMWPVYGAFAGTLVATVVLCAELNVRDSGAPALPWVNTGAIGGFAVGMVPVIL